MPAPTFISPHDQTPLTISRVVDDFVRQVPITWYDARINALLNIVAAMAQMMTPDQQRQLAKQLNHEEYNGR